MPIEAGRDTHLRRLFAPPVPILVAAVGFLSAAFPGGAGAQPGGSAFDTTSFDTTSSSTSALSATPAPEPATGFSAKNTPDDRGGAIDLSWQVSPDEAAHPERVLFYVLERGASGDGPWTAFDSAAAGNSARTDDEAPTGTTQHYRLTTVGPGGRVVSGTAQAQSSGEWFNTTRTSVFIILILFFLFVLYYISSAQKGKPLFVRRIPGIDAIEEAIGRATEMGRSVLYVPGIQDIDDIQTMASLTILESVAKMTAKYEAPIIVPTNYPVVFTLAQEMVKNGYVAAGRADAYDPNSVRYVTTEQFAYVAAVSGIMLRDKPAANIYLGAFFAESLLLAETGFSTRAIQVAGTAQVAQLPFFVVACDYTLIGEELYAASAYLSREPRLLGSLKGSDLMKVLLITLIVAGSLLETFGYTWLTNFMATQ